MVVRGKAVFAAQSAITAASDEYLTAIQQSINQDNHTKRLRNAIPQIPGNETTFKIVKVALAERILAVRNWVVLDFRQYVASYAWNCLENDQPITIDPLKDFASFKNDAATLQALAAQIGPRVRAQRRLFKFSSEHDLPTVTNFNVTTSEGSATTTHYIMTFTLDPENPVFQKFGRIRLRAARVYLDDLDRVDDEIISMKTTLGATMQDLSLQFLKATKDASGASPSRRTLQFITTESVFGFEYYGVTKEILMDGQLVNSGESSLLLSPFRTWNIEFDTKSSVQSRVSFRLELTCEVTYL